MGWQYWQDDMMGECEICPHGCSKPVGCIDRVCVTCDYPITQHLAVIGCATCGSMTWHADRICCRCGSEAGKDKEILLSR